MSDGLESFREPIEELTVEKLSFHPAVVRALEQLRANNLNLIRTAQPTDVTTIARAQASLYIIDLLLGREATQFNDHQPSLAESLVATHKHKKDEPRPHQQRSSR